MHMHYHILNLYAQNPNLCVYVHVCDFNSAIIFFLPVALLLNFYLSYAFTCWEELLSDILHCSSAAQDAAGDIFSKTVIFLSVYSNYSVIASIQLTSLGK